MADAIEQLRASTEAELSAIVAKLGPTHRRRVLDAVERYGSIAAIPAEVWESMKQEVDTQAAAVLLLLLAGTYGAEYRRITRQLPAENRVAAPAPEELQAAAAPVAGQAARMVADDYVDGMRNRLERNIDAKAQELNQLPPREAAKAVRDEIDAAIGEEAAAAPIIDNTARAVNASGESAAEDIGRQVGARVVVIWVIEDSKACSVCKSLDGKTSDEWGAILEGSGSSDAIGFVMNYGGAHPHCRCRRKYVLMDWSDN
jgi:hypothetical protein